MKHSCLQDLTIFYAIQRKIIANCHSSENNVTQIRSYSSIEVLELNSVSSSDLILEQKSVPYPWYSELLAGGVFRNYLGIEINNQNNVKT